MRTKPPKRWRGAAQDAFLGLVRAMPRTIGERKSSLRVAYQVKTQVRECVICHHGTALVFDGIEKPNHLATPNLVERGVAEAGIDQSLQRCLAISSGTEGRALTLKIFSQMAISVSRRTSPLRGSVPTSRLARAGVGLGGPSGRAPAFAAPGEVGRSMLSSLHG
jgi:hypothetical protein